MTYWATNPDGQQQVLSKVERRAMIRIELPLGMETQLDYGKVGTLHDLVSGVEPDIRIHLSCCRVYAIPTCR